MKSLNMILSFTAGTIAGVALGVLTAPRSGKETRKIISEEVNTKKDEMQLAAENRINEAKEILNKEVEKQTRKGKKAMDRFKEAVTV